MKLPRINYFLLVAHPHQPVSIQTERLARICASVIQVMTFFCEKSIQSIWKQTANADKRCSWWVRWSSQCHVHKWPMFRMRRSNSQERTTSRFSSMFKAGFMAAHQFHIVLHNTLFMGQVWTHVFTSCTWQRPAESVAENITTLLKMSWLNVETLENVWFSFWVLMKIRIIRKAESGRDLFYVVQLKHYITAFQMSQQQTEKYMWGGGEKYREQWISEWFMYQ